MNHVRFSTLLTYHRFGTRFQPRCWSFCIFSIRNICLNISCQHHFKHVYLVFSFDSILQAFLFWFLVCISSGNSWVYNIPNLSPTRNCQPQPETATGIRAGFFREALLDTMEDQLGSEFTMYAKAGFHCLLNYAGATGGEVGLSSWGWIRCRQPSMQIKVWPMPRKADNYASSETKTKL